MPLSLSLSLSSLCSLLLSSYLLSNHGTSNDADEGDAVGDQFGRGKSSKKKKKLSLKKKKRKRYVINATLNSFSISFLQETTIGSYSFLPPSLLIRSVQ